ncbi:MAG: C4-type zinc ribbon domain-containing protein [bacterium]|nr:C4-type zinc ribbon domain-containing protein [bacterium]
MKEELKTLWRLQKLDTEISKLEARKKNIPQEIQQLNKKLKAKEKELQKQKETFQEFITRRRNLEQDAEESKDRVRRYKAQLLQVKTNKEYQSILHEISTEEVKLSAYEEEIIDALTQSDELSKQIENLSKELEKDKDKFSKYEEKLQKELSEVENALLTKKDEYEKLTNKINSVILSRYQQIKRSRDGIGVVGISESTCKGCNAILPPQFVVEVRKGNKILTCEQCGRILIWEDDVD